MPDTQPMVLLDSFAGGGFGHSWRFRGYLQTLQALEPGEVAAVLAGAEEATANGLHAVGFLAYEAAAGLNPDLPVLPATAGLPLAWFAIFRERLAAGAAEPSEPETATAPPLEPEISAGDYRRNVERIKEYIAGGDSYQVNYTFPMSAPWSGEPLGLYKKAARAQQAPFNAYIDSGRFTVISASPELFFALKDGIIRTRPMKGTAPRGRWLEEDLQQISRLENSAKERAENLMIVDLLRNDLGMIAATGSVKVESLFDVETYPTLHQLTSTVSARVKAGIGLAGIFAALFPCGSITGAPKRRSMAIINELERRPRGVYCGAIGYLSPGGEALFSVAIRTLTFDREQATLSLGIGSGITADSAAQEEYQECLTKSSFLSRAETEFSLIESLRLENGGYPLLERHLERLGSSARFFGFRLDEGSVRQALALHARGRQGLHKVRLQLAKTGELSLTSEPLSESATPLTFALSRVRVDSGDRFRYHKTSCRQLLDAARQEQAAGDEVVFLNERGELTEGSYHNLLLRIDGQMLTPWREAGLLAGVMRQELLATGRIAEAILYPADMLKAEEIWLINSVRGLRRAQLVEGEQF